VKTNESSDDSREYREVSLRELPYFHAEQP